MEQPTEHGGDSAVQQNETSATNSSKHSAPSTSEAGDSAPQYLPSDISFTGLRPRNALLYETGPIAPPTRHFDELTFLLEGMRYPFRLYGPLYGDVYDDWSDSTSWHRSSSRLSGSLHGDIHDDWSDDDWSDFPRQDHSSSDSESGDGDEEGDDNAGQRLQPGAEEFVPTGAANHNFHGGQAHQQQAGAQQQLGGQHPAQHAGQSMALVPHQPAHQLPAFNAAFPQQGYDVHGWVLGQFHQHQQGTIQPAPGFGFGHHQQGAIRPPPGFEQLLTPMPPPLPLLLEAPAENDALPAAGPSRANNNDSNENYQGDASNPRNMSADIPEEDNCSFFITGLPSDLTMTELLGSLRNTGKIFQVTLNPPTGDFGTAAAKVIFFRKEDARRFLHQTHRASGFRVRDVLAQVKRNRIRVAEQKPPYSDFSRVVIIRGPAALVDMERSIRPILDERIRSYDIETYRAERVGRNEAELTICFGSCRAQAHGARIVIGRELGRRGVTVEFGRDPCEP